jgi:NADPH:quinone reductase-like Zn-dependent oxidoreductase
VSLDWPAAGACVEAFITAQDALSQAALRPGDAVLIHAAGSGVGLAAVQLASALGAMVFGTARGQDKLNAAREVGMIDGLIPGGEESIADAARRWTGGRGVEVVLDLLGGNYTSESIGALAMKGRLILIGTLAGASSAINLGHVLSKRVTIRGTVLRSRPLEEKISVTQAFGREVMPWLASGRLTPRIHAMFPLEQIADAHRLLEGNETIGKVAIGIFDDLPSAADRAT